ncbi:sugar-binding transcriptional regulator [Thermosediminibacter oceani]|uniref:Transcriptional regulator, DeoR family n=1 Tax=Thermosediminibacter oceani (strain ATCC BAA-1034 / DSM 16646 / JW/IW-1228P) TaxID=555079 RepID=D9RXW7_THEOJ|nr:sugar-binding transcriptional regulator [Thermosediminibacter oceani]ADL08191.1 transcriptional regulator, DeoR family [Thermosediminibacter oceani DSM 16646]
MNVTKDRRLLIKIAHMYYDENKTQQEIADKLGISRPSVSRLLQKAREEGIVEIKINYEGSFAKLEDTLEKCFNLKEVIITPYDEGEGLKRYLAEAAAGFLVRTLKDKSLVGVSWGTTLAYVPEYIKNAPELDATFIPLVGGVGQTRIDLHSNQIVMNLARCFSGRWQLLHAPALVDSVEVKNTLLSDSNIRQVLEMAERVDIALIGIGSPFGAESTMLETGYFSERELEDLKRSGVCCDLCSRFIDEHGNPCCPELNERVIAISLKKLKEIPLVIGVAGGHEKRKAILAALRGHYLDVLITDEKTGQFLMVNSKKTQI